MWTPTALASEVKSFGGTVWRVVEHQYTASTRKIVNTLADQDILETILEETKPLYPGGAEKLNYLLKTPFRYYPPNPYGSRFRRANSEHGVFYASENIRCALAEFAYGRLLFFSLSINTPLPRNQERLTAFTVSYETLYGLDLTGAPLNCDNKIWMGPTDYGATQTLAETARNANITVLRYRSTRDEEYGGINIALLSPGAFTCLSPLQEQSWYLYIGAMEINCIRALAAKESERWTFEHKHLKFDSDHKIILS